MGTEERLAGGFGFPLGCVAVVAAVIAAKLASAHPGYAVVAVALAVGAVAVITTPLAAGGVTAVGWSVLSGFGYGRAGTLVFTAATGWVAVILAGAAGFGLVAGAGWRAVRRDRPVIAEAVVPVPRRAVESGHRRVASL
ncbi:hypothetical protein G3I59_36405 [Amycolatopsis rubida]|uniref:Uncharacterized protein n=1 Tax=Amycolatopsis rubida TaxID=112413 RepID=A0A1I5Z6W2_9PSEU|nr:hypothetical protein [Amycolatopsis rubida]MYW95946.1 hypothetical protein [Amycolatopsis rubida]NEC60936.1 hypothetical protein [Amycolatopsis rubida]SFQ52181.1 hypothetical protein SAMN05421854_11432 [Amycolatopsis rubida]